MQEKLGGSFVIESALALLGLDQQQKAIVRAAIPDAPAVAGIISKNMSTIVAFVALINQLMPYVQKDTRVVQILVDAVARLQQRYG